ncbi:helix-turn-helix transcriptional regulator [Clostridium sp. FS41]|uniref:helix-turn-helix transcriptional regulator n=1 Tax=Clostridium sp. FS41 TaxID=1609975 RepID=UPI00061E14E9|nr:helix-turn-helix transcriptional regulator [Clostridium sp. FS41]KJJ66855.1 helix-turn-helix domain protein [Clostridium sp. FS41]
MNEEIRDRIGKVREHFQKSQEEFGTILGVTNSTISLLERKKRDPSDRLVRDICREFNINEKWLRTGKGEMFNKMDATDLVFSHFGSIMGNASAQKKAVLSALVEMVYCVPDDKWDYIFNQFESCLKEAHKDPEED